MRRIVVLAQNLAVDSEVVQYAARIGRASRAEVVCLSLVASYASTAELIHSQPEETIARLRTLQARQTTAEWVRTLEEFRAKQWEETERQKRDLKVFFKSRGVGFSSHIVRFDSATLFKSLEELLPFDLLIGSRMRFPSDLAAQGFMTLGDLGARFSCPAIDVEVMGHFLQPAPSQFRRELATYGVATLVFCLLFWLHAEEINHFLLKGGILAAAAIMAGAAGVAWSYGKTLQCLFKLIKADIY
jgi:hypothetical protein